MTKEFFLKNKNKYSFHSLLLDQKTHERMGVRVGRVVYPKKNGRAQQNALCQRVEFNHVRCEHRCRPTFGGMQT